MSVPKCPSKVDNRQLFFQTPTVYQTTNTLSPLTNPERLHTNFPFPYTNPEKLYTNFPFLYTNSKRLYTNFLPPYTNPKRLYTNSLSPLTNFERLQTKTLPPPAVVPGYQKSPYNPSPASNARRKCLSRFASRSGSSRLAASRIISSFSFTRSKKRSSRNTRRMASPRPVR